MAKLKSYCTELSAIESWDWAPSMYALMKTELQAKAFDVRSLAPMWTYEPDHGAPFYVTIDVRRGVVEAFEGIGMKRLEGFDMLRGPVARS